eukprot:symbB.v1.2.017666.t1/scaffold1380.1/size122483/4
MSVLLKFVDAADDGIVLLILRCLGTAALVRLASTSAFISSRLEDSRPSVLHRPGTQIHDSPTQIDVALLLLGRSSTFTLLAGADSRGKVQISTEPSAVATRAFTTAPVAEPPEDLMSIKQRHLAPSAQHMEYAIVEYSGRQHMVTVGDMYETYFIRAVPGSKVRLNRVLLLKQKKGEDPMKDGFDVHIGQPLVDGAYVEITVLEHLKGEDQIIFKHKKKKHYMKRWIVNQKLTRFRVDKLALGSPDEPVTGRAPYPLGPTAP